MVCANKESLMILNVRCKIDVCGVRRIDLPSVLAMVKSPLLNGSAMLALPGTRSRIWCSWHRLCHVQCDPMILLSGWRSHWLLGSSCWRSVFFQIDPSRC